METVILPAHCFHNVQEPEQLERLKFYKLLKKKYTSVNYYNYN